MTKLQMVEKRTELLKIAKEVMVKSYMISKGNDARMERFNKAQQHYEEVLLDYDFISELSKTRKEIVEEKMVDAMNVLRIAKNLFNELEEEQAKEDSDKMFENVLIEYDDLSINEQIEYNGRIEAIEKEIREVEEMEKEVEFLFCEKHLEDRELTEEEYKQCLEEMRQMSYDVEMSREWHINNINEYKVLCGGIKWIDISSMI